MQLRTQANKDRFGLTTVYLLYLLALFVFSFYTSPLYPHRYGEDAALFSLLGKGILNDKTLYIDLFDHKGPLIFLINALGHWIGGYIGIFTLQFIFGCISLTFLYYTAKMLIPNPKTVWAYILPLVCAYSVFCYTFQGGNLTEEYSQPFISCAIYLFVKYATRCDKAPTHPPLYAFFYGVLLASLAFLRLNNSVTVCAGILAIFVYLIYKKELKSLILNILAGCCGLAAVAIPICLYFQQRSALYEMIYATFLYNLNIVSGSSGQQPFFDHIVKFSVLLLPIVICLVLLCLHIIKKKVLTFVDVLLGCILFFNCLSFYLANRFPHYFAVFTPVYAVFLFRYFTIDKTKLSIWLVAVCTVVNLLPTGYYSAANFYACHISKNPEFVYSSVHNAIDVIPESERDNVIGYQIPVSYYILGDIIPCYKYYTWQESWAAINPQILVDFMEYVRSEQPLWILTTPQEDNPDLTKTLDEKYDQIFYNKLLICYRLKEPQLSNL